MGLSLAPPAIFLRALRGVPCVRAAKKRCDMLDWRELPPSRDPGPGEPGRELGGEDIGVENGLLRGTVMDIRPGLGGRIMLRGEGGD